jgi:hypothetical protein
VASSETEARLDQLASLLAGRAGLHFSVATTGRERAAALALRHATVAERCWSDASSDADEFDERAVHVVGWDGDRPVCCGRLVLPGAPLPTEVACGVEVEPVGQVVDVGRMVVVSAARDRRATVFLALLAALYLETRRRGFTVGCGLMASNVRALLRLMGVPLRVLGPELEHRGEWRAPVRFAVEVDGAALLARWAATDMGHEPAPVSGRGAE